MSETGFVSEGEIKQAEDAHHAALVLPGRWPADVEVAQADHRAGEARETLREVLVEGQLAPAVDVEGALLRGTGVKSVLLQVAPLDPVFSSERNRWFHL